MHTDEKEIEAILRKVLSKPSVKSKLYAMYQDFLCYGFSDINFDEEIED